MNTAKILMLVGILGWVLGCSRVNPVGVDEIGVEEQADEKSLEQQKYIKGVYSLQPGQTVNETTLSTLTSNLAANKIEPFQITYDCLKNPAYFKMCSPQSNGGLINRAYLTLLATKPSTAAYNTWLSLIG